MGDKSANWVEGSTSWHRKRPWLMALLLVYPFISEFVLEVLPRTGVTLLAEVGNIYLSWASTSLCIYLCVGDPNGEQAWNGWPPSLRLQGAINQVAKTLALLAPVFWFAIVVTLVAFQRVRLAWLPEALHWGNNMVLLGYLYGMTLVESLGGRRGLAVGFMVLLVLFGAANLGLNCARGRGWCG